jgi:hypothetical protein
MIMHGKQEHPAVGAVNAWQALHLLTESLKIQR